MKKVAKLVTVSLKTRVIVDENATEEQIMFEAIPKLAAKFAEDGQCDHIDEICDDEECPFGTFDEDEAIFYEVLGYKTAEDFNERNFELLGDGFLSFKDAEAAGKTRSGEFAIIKVQSSDREEIETFSTK